MIDAFSPHMEAVAPLTPADCDLRDFQFMPVDIVRLFGSRFHAISTDAEWRAGVTLWLKSFHQVPAGSLPNDDVELCRLAELGRDLRTWKKVRENALHGWVLCSDNRYYHPVVCEKAVEAWAKRVSYRERAKKGNEKRWGGADRQAERQGGTGSEGRDQDHDDEPSGTEEGSQEHRLAIAAASQGTGTGTGTGTKKDTSLRSERRATRLPPEWEPSADLRTYAYGKGFSVSQVDRIVEKFRNYWTAKSGSAATKLDWAATWRNWVITESERSPQTQTKRVGFV